MIASLHAQYVKTGNEDIFRFEEALKAEVDRAKGKHIPSGFNYPSEYLLYREVGKYFEQLRRYFSEFGRKGVHVIIFDDFQSDSEREFVAVCKFLGIPVNTKIDFTKNNPARTPRVIMLHQASFRLKVIERAVVKALRPIVPSQVRKVLGSGYHSLWALNMKAGRVPVSNETRMTLVSFYKPEIKRLENLLGRDLRDWCVSNDRD